MAQAVFEHLISKRGIDDDWTVDSAGTGAWHVGEPPDPRTLKVLSKHQINTDQVARSVQDSDFAAFDYLLAMDEDNLRVLQDRAPASCDAEINLLGDYDPEGRGEVPDPYYGGPDGFDNVYAMVSRCCESFLEANAD
jgi:protein-tyrosine-phosphatase